MLTMPDNRSIQQGTLQLKTAFSDPNVVPSLVDVLKASSNPTVRQYAAILLRKRIVKHWNKLNTNVKHSLESALVQCLSAESEHIVRNAICQVISSIARHKFKNEGWPEVMVFIANAVQSGNVQEKEIGYLLLHCICSACGELLKPFYKELFPVFEQGMNEKGSKKAAFYSIKALTSIVPSLGSDEEGLIKPLIPKALEIVKVLLQEDEDKACEALELFDELVEIEVGIVIPYVKALVELCLQIVQCNDYGDPIRVKSLYLLCWACRRKAKALLKSHLLHPLLETLLTLMSLSESGSVDEENASSQGNDDNEDDLGELDGSTLPSVAAQALDLLALHLPPAKFIPQVMSMIQSYLDSVNQYQRKAGYIALGVLAEGCADYIKNRHLREALQTVSKGFTDESNIVRNASLFTLGQFAEHFQHDMNKFHRDIIPALLSQMQNTLVTEDLKQKTTLSRLFYALESLCENLEKSEISLYLNSLVETFLNTIKASKGLYATELAISAIGSLASSAKDELLPYFPHIMDHLKAFIQEPATLETSSLQAQAIDTLGSLARNIGEKNFKQLADECMQLGMMLLEDSDDPDVRRCTYGLFASLSTILKNDMEKYLSQIVPKMMESLKSFEGFMSQIKENEPAFLLDDDLDEEDIALEDDEDDEVEGYTVENAYLDEKEDTCNAIGEIAEQTKQAFLPYIEECFNEVQLFVDDSNVNLRKAAIMACASLAAVMKSALKRMDSVDQAPANILTSKVFAMALSLIRKNLDQSCVMAAVDAINEILKSFKGGDLQSNEITHQIASVAHDLFLEKIPCQQDGDDSYEEGDEESQAEMDAILIEKAGDMLPLLAQAVGGAVFKPYFDGFLPLLIKRTKKSSAVSERSFAVGTLAEVIQAMESFILPYVDQLLQLFFITLKDEDEEVISNSVFAIGVLAECGKDSVVKHYSDLLQLLFSIADKNPSHLIMDNICGAVSRMILTNYNALPLAQIIPVLIHHLPIQEDKSENDTFMKCICFLYTNAYPSIESFVGQLLGHMLQSALSKDSGLKSETRHSLMQVLKDIQGKFPSDFENVLASMGLSQSALSFL